MQIFCLSCGSPLPAWFDPTERLYDVAQDDEAYLQWLDTPCQECGRTPREGGAK